MKGMGGQVTTLVVEESRKRQTRDVRMPSARQTRAMSWLVLLLQHCVLAAKIPED
jgi:hypothetical protein